MMKSRDNLQTQKKAYWSAMDPHLKPAMKIESHGLDNLMNSALWSKNH